MPNKEKPTDAGRRGGLKNPPAQTSAPILSDPCPICNARRSAWQLARLSRALPKPALGPTRAVVNAPRPNLSTTAAGLKRRAVALPWNMQAQLNAAGVGHPTIHILMGGA